MIMKNKTSILIYPFVIMLVCLMLSSACKKDDNTNNNNNTGGTVSDINGNAYNTVTIGSLVWMVQDLKTTKYCNGDSIPNVIQSSEWSALTTSAYCNYDNQVSNGSIYGHLYNYKAVSDSRKLCPAGWHVATDADWTTLTTLLGGNTIAGGKLKETGTTHWLAPNTGATDSYGFKALPNGERRSTASFDYLGEYANWWTATEYDASQAWVRYISNTGVDITRQLYNKGYGYAVRCVKD